MECPKCKARIGIMKHLIMVETGAIHSLKCFICGFWVQTDHGKGMNETGPSLMTAGAPGHGVGVPG